MDIQVSWGDNEKSVIGQLHTVQDRPVTSIVAESSSGERTAEVTVDRQGRFSFATLPVGFIRLKCHRPRHAAVVTTWISF
jgi:hypothetical protein